MEKRTVQLPQEVWDRLITILDMLGRNDPDTTYILQMIYSQLTYSPADEQPKIVQKNQ